METALTFDDVLLSPKHSTVQSRSEVDLSTSVTPSIEIDKPFVSAPMDTVTGPELAQELANVGGLPIIPRHGVFEDVRKRGGAVGNVDGPVGAAIGIDGVNTKSATLLEASGADVLCVDTAHGHLSKALDTVYEVSRATDVDIIAGNVATGEAAKGLSKAGADAIKVGIGPGSSCTTREKTGVGVPQITATQRVSKALDSFKIMPDKKRPSIITDGGMRNSGDMAKALMAGADAVMHGRLFAECTEAPNNGQMYGLASDEIDGSGATEGDTRDLDGDQEPVAERVEDWAESIRSTCSYCGGHNLHEARQNAEFVRVTSNAVDRNGVH